MLKYLLLFLQLLTLIFAEQPEICIELENGSSCFLGSTSLTEKGTRYASFQGLRFAQPPVKDLRFKSPVPYPMVNGTFDVSGKSNIECPQFAFDGSGITGQCL